jgi:hypothetical protein
VFQAEKSINNPFPILHLASSLLTKPYFYSLSLSSIKIITSNLFNTFLDNSFGQYQLPTANISDYLTEFLLLPNLRRSYTTAKEKVYGNCSITFSAD